MKNEPITKDNIEVGKMYLIKETHDAVPCVLVLESLGRSNATFRGSIPTRNDLKRFIRVSELHLYVSVYDEMQHRRYFYTPKK